MNYPEMQTINFYDYEEASVYIFEKYGDTYENDFWQEVMMSLECYNGSFIKLDLDYFTDEKIVEEVKLYHKEFGERAVYRMEW